MAVCRCPSRTCARVLWPMSEPTFRPNPSFSILANQSPRATSEPPQLPVITDGHTVQQIVVSARNLLDRAFDVGVDVDEPGRQDSAGRIDRSISRSGPSAGR